MKFSTGAVLSWSSLLLASSVFAQQEAVAPEDSAVVKLATDSFNEYIQSHDLVLAEFLLHGVATVRTWLLNTLKPPRL